jgi:hypothetical protein
MQSELNAVQGTPEKLIAVADLHFSVGTGDCRDTDKTPCAGDADTLKWLGEALDAEKPDLVASPSITSIFRCEELISGILGRPTQWPKDILRRSKRFSEIHQTSDRPSNPLGSCIWEPR